MAGTGRARPLPSAAIPAARGRAIARRIFISRAIPMSRPSGPAVSRRSVWWRRVAISKWRQSGMARRKRRKAYDPSNAYDRRAQDLPLNAEVAAVEVDDPMGLEPGDRIVALRSTRGDPLAKLHTHRQIDEAQFRGGRAFQNDWERAERGPRAIDPTRERVDGGQMREPVTEGQRRAVVRLNRIEHELGADGRASCR